MWFRYRSDGRKETTGVNKETVKMLETSLGGPLFKRKAG
jgi:hypothetical protein